MHEFVTQNELTTVDELKAKVTWDGVSYDFPDGEYTIDATEAACDGYCLTELKRVYCSDDVDLVFEIVSVHNDDVITFHVTME